MPARPRGTVPSGGPCQILLVRHGRTALNVAGRFRGRQDPPLDREGLAEARRAARYLAGAGLAAVYTSPLRRARATARAIAERSGVRLRVDPDLADLDYGRWTGKTPEEVRREAPVAYRRFRRDPLTSRLPGGEAVQAVLARVDRTLVRLADRFPNRTVVAVTHDVVIRLVVGQVLHRRGAALWRIAVPTGSITRLQAARGRLRVVGRVGARPPG